MSLCMEIHLEKCVSLRQIVSHHGDTPREVCQPQTNSRPPWRYTQRSVSASDKQQANIEIHLVMELEKCVSLRQIVGHHGDTPREVCQPQTNSRPPWRYTQRSVSASDKQQATMEIHLEKCVSLRQIVGHHGDTPREVCQPQTNSRPPWRYTQRSVSASDKQQATMEIHLEKCVSLRQIVGHHGDTHREVCQPQTNSRPPWRYTQRSVSASDKQQATMEIHLEKCVSLRQIVGHHGDTPREVCQPQTNSRPPWRYTQRSVSASDKQQATMEIHLEKCVSLRQIVGHHGDTPREVCQPQTNSRPPWRYTQRSVSASDKQQATMEIHLEKCVSLRQIVGHHGDTHREVCQPQTNSRPPWRYTQRSVSASDKQQATMEIHQRSVSASDKQQATMEIHLEKCVSLRQIVGHHGDTPREVCQPQTNSRPPWRYTQRSVSASDKQQATMEIHLEKCVSLRQIVGHHGDTHREVCQPQTNSRPPWRYTQRSVSASDKQQATMEIHLEKCVSLRQIVGHHGDTHREVCQPQTNSRPPWRYTQRSVSASDKQQATMEIHIEKCVSLRQIVGHHGDTHREVCQPQTNSRPPWRYTQRSVSASDKQQATMEIHIEKCVSLRQIVGHHGDTPREVCQPQTNSRPPWRYTQRSVSASDKQQATMEIHIEKCVSLRQIVGHHGDTPREVCQPQTNSRPPWRYTQRSVSASDKQQATMEIHLEKCVSLRQIVGHHGDTPREVCQPQTNSRPPWRYTQRSVSASDKQQATMEIHIEKCVSLRQIVGHHGDTPREVCQPQTNSRPPWRYTQRSVSASDKQQATMEIHLEKCVSLRQIVGHHGDTHREVCQPQTNSRPPWRYTQRSVSASDKQQATMEIHLEKCVSLRQIVGHHGDTPREVCQPQTNSRPPWRYTQRSVSASDKQQATMEIHLEKCVSLRQIVGHHGDTPREVCQPQTNSRPPWRYTQRSVSASDKQQATMEIHLEKCVSLRQIVGHHGDTPREVCQPQTNSRPPWRYTQRSVSASDKQQATMEIHIEKCVSLRQIVGHHGDTPREVCQPQTNSRPPWRYTQRSVSASDKQQATMEIHLEKCVSLRQIVGHPPWRQATMEIHLEKCVSLRQIVGHHGDTPREVCQPQTNSRPHGDTHREVCQPQTNSRPPWRYTQRSVSASDKQQATMEIHIEKCVSLRQIVGHHGDTPREVCQPQTNSRPPWRYTQRSVSASDKQQATMEIHLEKCVSLRQIVGHHGDTHREVCQPQTNSRPPWRYTQRSVSASDKQQATMEIHIEKCVSLRQIVGHHGDTHREVCQPQTNSRTPWRYTQRSVSASDKQQATMEIHLEKCVSLRQIVGHHGDTPREVCQPQTNSRPPWRYTQRSVSASDKQQATMKIHLEKCQPQTNSRPPWRYTQRSVSASDKQQATMEIHLEKCVSLRQIVGHHGDTPREVCQPQTNSRPPWRYTQRSVSASDKQQATIEIHLEKCVSLRQIVGHHGDTPREVCQPQTNSRPPWRYTQRSVSASDKQQATMEIHLEKCVSLRQIVGHHGDTHREVCQPQTNSRPPQRYTQRSVSASDKQQATMEIHLEKCVSLRQIVGHHGDTPREVCQPQTNSRPPWRYTQRSVSASDKQQATMEIHLEKCVSLRQIVGHHGDTPREVSASDKQQATMEIHIEKCVSLRQIVGHHGDTPREVCQLQTNSRPPWRYTQRSVSASDKQQATLTQISCFIYISLKVKPNIFFRYYMPYNYVFWHANTSCIQRSVSASKQKVGHHD